ncbi:MAG: aminotransferase class V-fold PLP-dependent enzyme, partial [Pseudomonadota bacterium]
MSAPYDVHALRRDFPILSREVHGKPLVYLDNGASAQKPQAVIDAVSKAYSQEYANVHRGLHFLSNLATEKYEAVRETIQRFLGAEHSDEIVFTTGTTEALNLVAYGWAEPRIEEGDEILLTVMEHHANIVPWHFLRER